MQARRIAFLMAVLGVLGSLPGSVLAVDAGSTLDGTTDTVNDTTGDAVDDVQGQTEANTGAGVPSFNTTLGVAFSPVTDPAATCYDRYESFFLEAFPPALDGYSTTLAYSVCYAPQTVRDQVADQCGVLIWATYGDGAQDQREMARNLMESVCTDAIRNGDLDGGMGSVDACSTADVLGVSFTSTESTVSLEYVLGLLTTAQGTPCETVLAAGHDAHARAWGEVVRVDSDTKRYTPHASARADTAGTWVLQAKSKLLSTSTFESGWSTVSGSKDTLACTFDVTATDTTGGSCSAHGATVEVQESNDVVYKWRVDYTLTWVDATGTSHKVLTGTETGYL